MVRDPDRLLAELRLTWVGIVALIGLAAMLVLLTGGAARAGLCR